jgi:hypothetical protein
MMERCKIEGLRRPVRKGALRDQGFFVLGEEFEPPLRNIYYLALLERTKG